MKADYESRLTAELENLLALFPAMCAINEYDLDKLHDQVHKIRGEAGTFGYDLVSNIGKLLCELLSPIEEVTEIDQKAISAHLNAMLTLVCKKSKAPDRRWQSKSSRA